MVSSKLVPCFLNEEIFAVGSCVPFVGSRLSVFIVWIDWSVNKVSLENLVLEIFNLVDVFRRWDLELFIFLLFDFLVIHCRLNNADVELVRDHSRCPASSIDCDYRLVHIDSVFATLLRRLSWCVFVDLAILKLSGLLGCSNTVHIGIFDRGIRDVSSVRVSHLGIIRLVRPHNFFLMFFLCSNLHCLTL